MAEIALDRLTRSFPSAVPAGLFDLSLRVSSGELIAIVGPSGAGKTTLLRLLAGLERPDSGTIRIGNRDVTFLASHERNVGLVAQRAAVYPHLSVERNLSIGLEMWQSRHAEERLEPAEVRRRVEEAIEAFQLRPILERRSDQLSGGEQQRLALGRLLVRRPPVWLLDEPLSHLDSQRKNDFRRHLHLLRGMFPATIILVTHDPVEALTLGQRVAVLNAGRLHQVGSPSEVYARPADRFVAGFLGWPPFNLADGVLVRSPGADGGLRFAAADGSVHLPVPAELVTHGAGGRPVTAGIRPEDLRPAVPADTTSPVGPITLPGWRVARAEFVPPRWLVTVEHGGLEWRLWLREPVAAGTRMDLCGEPGNLHWFDGANGKSLMSCEPWWASKTRPPTLPDGPR